MGALAEEVRTRPKLPVPAVRQAIRRNADVSQDRMACELGVHRVTFLRWERGDRTPRGARLDAYARLLRELDEATRPDRGPAESTEALIRAGKDAA